MLTVVNWKNMTYDSENANDDRGATQGQNYHLKKLDVTVVTGNGQGRLDKFFLKMFKSKPGLAEDLRICPMRLYVPIPLWRTEVTMEDHHQQRAKYILKLLTDLPALLQ